MSQSGNGGITSLSELPVFAATRKRAMDKNILILLQNGGMMTLCAPLLRALSEYHVTVFIPPRRGQHVARLHPGLAHVAVTDEEGTLLLNMHRFGLVITTLGIPCNVQMYVAGLLLEAAHACGIRVLEIQHGMFQWGHLFTDIRPVLSDPARAGGSHGLGRSVNMHDAYIPWFGENAIGYPLSELPKAAGKGVLVATNLHWHIYTVAERLAFRDAVVQAARKRPDTLFLWKPHTGDYDLVSGWVKAASLANLLITPRNESRSFEAIAQDFSMAVSMPSTVLLSLEAMGLPTAIFSCAGNAEMIRQFTSGHFFSTTEELDAMLDSEAFQVAAVSGFLLPFNPTAWQAAVAQHFKQTPNSPFPNLAVWNAFQRGQKHRWSYKIRHHLLLPLYRGLSRLTPLRAILHHPSLRRALGKTY